MTVIVFFLFIKMRHERNRDINIIIFDHPIKVDFRLTYWILTHVFHLQIVFVDEIVSLFLMVIATLMFDTTKTIVFQLRTNVVLMYLIQAILATMILFVKNRFFLVIRRYHLNYNVTNLNIVSFLFKSLPLSFSVYF